MFPVDAVFLCIVCIVKMGDTGWAGNLIFSLCYYFAYLLDVVFFFLLRLLATLYHHLLHYIVLTLITIFPPSTYNKHLQVRLIRKQL